MRFILIVEDDAGVREGMATLLDAEGYRVEAVDGGSAALELMRQRVPSLVLLDLMMPDMTGWAVHAAMRDHPRLRDVPVCVVSAVPNEAPAGVAAVLDKPLNIPKLLRIIAEYY
jgi:CheY-like chemotaxis protein